jgi:EmrB/QacA subfamily drug resistance transporter
MASTSPDAAPRTARPGIVLLLACGATFLAYVDATIVNVAFPSLRSSFPESSIADLSWVVSGYAIFFAALLTPAGRLADVVGRKRLFLVSIGGFAVASAVCAAAPNTGTLIGARLVQGAFAAGMIPAALAVVLTEMPPERRVKSIGIWGAAGSLAAAAGPALGGLLIEATDWRLVFIINVPIGLGVALYGIRALRADQPSGNRFPDVTGTVALTAGIGLLVLGLTEGEEWGWASALTLIGLIGGPVLIAFALVRSRRHEVPAIELDLWRSRVFSTANITAALAGVAMFSWLLSGPLFLTTIWNYSILEAGFAVTPGALTAAVGAIAVGRLTNRQHQRIAVTIGMTAFAVTCLWMWTAIDTQPAFLQVWLGAGLLGGAGLGMTMTGLTTAASLSVPPLRFATATGLNIAARQVGGALGVAAVAVITSVIVLNGPRAFHAMWIFAGIAGLVAAIASLGLLERASRPAAAPVASQATTD